MSDWFFMLGEPLASGEVDCVRAYLRGLGLDETVPVESARDWISAGALIQAPDWDRSWWDAEQAEARRLYVRAAAARGEGELVQALSAKLDGANGDVHGRAAVQAARAGIADAALIRAAAGALSHALYLDHLAQRSGAGEAHPFSLKRALFTGGHWPLGIVGGRYYVF